MTIDLKSMAVMMPEVTAHPNRTAFRGVLSTVDVPSQRSPSGARGHLVVLTREAAEAALPSLLGMGVDYSPSLDRHDVRRKVGVITRAEIAGRNLELGGYLYARDFPEIVEEIAKSGERPLSIHGRGGRRTRLLTWRSRGCDRGRKIQYERFVTKRSESDSEADATVRADEANSIRRGMARRSARRAG